jgi:hypothetical protein
VIYKKDYLNQFIPEKYLYLLKTDKILYRGFKLKTAYLVDIMNEFILKYYFQKDESLLEKEMKFNVWSVLLREKYGTFYNYYIDYLVENEFMIMVSDYYKNQKARTYKLNSKSIHYIKMARIKDKVLIKKSSKEYLSKSFLYKNNSPIPLDIREKLVNYLYDIKIDVDSSMKFINDMKDSRKMDHCKYQKNLMSIENLKINDIFFRFDEYGRMHTNFTVLKREIRKNFITFNGIPTYELDIKNSQPLFLIVLMIEKLTKSELIKQDVSKYIDLVKNGLIYEYIVENKITKTRDDAKILMYTVLFGKNGHKRKENILFHEHFPTVYEFIRNYKESAKDYKILSHDLQLKESDFIYNKVIRHIMSVYPNIPMFTVHDSINIPIKYKDEVENIFDYYLRNLITL